MKRIFKKTFAFFCMLLFLMSSVFAFPETDVSLHQKYEYAENFQYNDEIIAHALKATVPQIRMSYSATVQYKPVRFDEDYVIDQLTRVYEVYGDSVSVDEVIDALQTDMNQNIESYLTFGSQKQVDTSGVFTGSGVVLGENGYIGTNSHVVSLGEESKKELYYYGLQEEITDDIASIIGKFNEYGVALSDADMDGFYQMIFEAATAHMEIEEDLVRLEVWFPTADGETSSAAAKIYEATVVAEGTQDGIDGLTQDTAILKIDAKNLVALNISSGYPELNSKIVSAGFPVAADTPFMGLGSEESTLSITVGNGSVARLIPIEGTDYQAIGITSTLSGGSSGGPSVDAGLNVEGLNTYINAQDERYGYMIPAEVVKNLSSGLKLGQNDLSKTFMTGLQLLQNNYGPAALECFERVARENPDTPYIKNLITLAKNAPQNQFVGTQPEKSLLIPIIIVGAAVVLVLVLIIVLVLVKKKKKAGARMPKAGTVPLYHVDPAVSRDPMRTAPRAAVEATVPLVTYTPPAPVMHEPTVNPTVPRQPVSPAMSRQVANPGVPNPAVPRQAAPTPTLRSTMPNMHGGSSEGTRNTAPSTHSAFERPSDL